MVVGGPDLPDVGKESLDPPLILSLGGSKRKEKPFLGSATGSAKKFMLIPPHFKPHCTFFFDIWAFSRLIKKTSRNSQNLFSKKTRDFPTIWVSSTKPKILLVPFSFQLGEFEVKGGRHHHWMGGFDVKPDGGDPQGQTRFFFHFNYLTHRMFKWPRASTRESVHIVFLVSFLRNKPNVRDIRSIQLLSAKYGIVVRLVWPWSSQEHHFALTVA